MVFTSEDLVSVQAAIIALASGSRTVSVTIGAKTIQYGEARLDRLKTLRDEMLTELQSSTTRRQFVLTSTAKGIF